jgi:hypothetical protein
VGGCRVAVGKTQSGEVPSQPPPPTIYIYIQLQMGRLQQRFRSNISPRVHPDGIEGGKRTSSPMAELYLVRCIHGSAPP